MKRPYKKICGFMTELCIFIIGILIIAFMEMDDDSPKE